ncbi:MAG: HAMP domain-containing sensor histidine kinase [Eubacteriales bacterium]|nr:HAMP domain-containing sensor histidine kinase [Eubacteriales bacterium]
MRRDTERRARRKSFHHSIRAQFAAVFFLLVLGTILLCLILNNLFLGTYYQNEKQRIFLSAYERLQQAAQEEAITSDSFDVELIQLTNTYNIGVIVMDSNSKTLKCYATDPLEMSRRLWENLFGTTPSIEEIQGGGTGETRSDGGTETTSAESSGSQEEAEEDSQPEEQPGGDLPDSGDTVLLHTIKTDGEYELQIVLDRRTSTEYMEMWGFLSNGDLFLIRAALESIRNSVTITNRFLLYTGMAAALCGTAVALWIAGRLTRPIREMAVISDRMKHLDFNAKYSGKGKNELGELGANINELSEALEETISELKTANNELRQDIEKKEQIDEMRKEFLSNVSHELKTPIALIQGYAEGLQDCINDDAESREFYCSVIIDESAKMNNMVKKLMTLNQLEFGNETVTMERFDIVDVIRNYLSSAALLAQKQEVTVRMEQEAPVYVWADEFFAEEVFTNYYSNALHHVSGDKVVDIRFEQKENCVRISVFNTGRPIPAESLPHLWEKFYKVDKARTREYGGSGIGLSIVKAIMDTLHQSYGVINYDNGVEFWFELDTGSGLGTENGGIDGSHY